jgi:hypothetical protein
LYLVPTRSDFIAGHASREPPFCHSLHFLWCMAQRSLHAFTKVNPRSFVLLCHRFPLVGYHSVPSGPFHNCEGFSLLGITLYPQTPLAPCGLVGIAIPVPHFRQDKLTRAFLISHQVVPYQTCGATCCPGGSTPETRSLADLSMNGHIT